MESNMNQKDEWEVVVDSVEPDDPQYPLVYRTKGFADLGFGGEVMVAGKMKDNQRIVRLINNFCRLMKIGETFEPNHSHSIVYGDGSPDERFNVIQYSELNNGVKYQLVPDFTREKDKFDDGEDDDDENNIDWVIIMSQTGIAEVNIDDFSKPNNIFVFVTDGFESHGFGGEVVVYGFYKDRKYIAGMINNFCSLLIQGDFFEANRIHVIHNHDKIYRFGLVEYGDPIDDKIKYQLVPYPYPTDNG